MHYNYQRTVYHEGLNKYRVVKGRTPDEAEEKAFALQRQWEGEWTRKCERQQKMKANNDAVEAAKLATALAEQVQIELDRIVLGSLTCSAFDFEVLKNNSIFSEPCPKEPSTPKYPRKPQRTDVEFNPSPSLATKLFKKKKAAFEAANQTAYITAYSEWQHQVDQMRQAYDQSIERFLCDLEIWKKKKADFEAKQRKHNESVDLFEKNVNAHRKVSLEQFFSMILCDAPCPIDYEREVDTEYQVDSRTLIVDLLFPSFDNTPSLKSVSYIKTRQEYKKSYYPETYLRKKYESIIYQIVLQSLNICFNNPNVGEALETIVFNGRIHSVDKATGNQIEPCILSLTVSRAEFLQLNLSGIDPKTWFKKSKGISATALADVTPVAPLCSISKEDKRFVDAYEVADTLNEGSNLAAMNWKDFEHLIRELFEKEFCTNGGEVKITQASRDGGVDAIAFDPDPIRGGKIIIQAKRYTNIVGVSAVRDLYGTVMNEGATKGILVTTSSYGSDSFAFARNKPITLLDGGNLLSLLAKHGYKARIDLNEAKITLHEKATS